MPTPPADVASPLHFLALAHAAEAAGDLALALTHCLAAVRGDPRHARALVGIGLALYRRGRIDAATEAFREATEAQPGLADAWGNLAAMLGESGRVPDALAALDHAFALAPDLAELHGLRGDLLRLGGETDNVVESYAHAVRLRPGAPELLNKLGCAQRRAGDKAAAEASLRRALSLAPAFGLAQVNLGTLYLMQRRLAEGRVLLRQALADPELDADARYEASVALAVGDDHDRLAPAITEAVAQEHDAPILRSVSSVPAASLPCDERMLAMFAKLATQASATATRPLARGAPGWPGWPAVEAHFALHLGDEPDAILRSTGYLAAHAEERSRTAISSTERDLQRYFRAVLCRQKAVPPEGDGAAWEARLRFWHAMLTWEHPELAPGQFKFMPNLVYENPLIPRAKPEDVAGTTRHFFAGPYRDTPRGSWRAALVYYAITSIHGFANGNGRLARFAANLELESAGFHPIVLTDRASKSVAAALTGVRILADLLPLVELFAKASAETATLVERLGNHGESQH
jgi:Flp pilus assembly protein TadD